MKNWHKILNTYWELLQKFIIYDFGLFYVANLPSWNWSCIRNAWWWIDEDYSEEILEERWWAYFFKTKQEALKYIIEFFEGEVKNNDGNEKFYKDMMKKAKLTLRSEFWTWK